ncbi:putative BSD domain-containing protein C22A12.14c [Glarea lozoyensis 74030]|uniref:Putative BSD domain-containing protein C22A12.14c n=1 Tax=Glarea lozoyensis (strain ATCC 74030 / MF5533) TaxID=1104152 RepID=H0ER44_GLAL7|nr:putative BSD domain-containing protein C22A12.14c [Glarea lozoyensis 74030]
MDLAYDHIQEEALSPDEPVDKKEKKPETTLNSDFQEAYKAISSSPWGAKLGGFFGSVVKQSSLISRTRALSVAQNPETSSESAKEKDGERDVSTEETLKESEGVLARLKSEAAKRLKDIQHAEDAADEALLKFGTNLRDFLKDALHVIHSSLESFTKDPVSDEYEPWTQTFDVEKKTEDISKDLENFTELRTSMEKLVPDTVKYEDFWKRYYFLRHSIETAEARRRDLLKGLINPLYVASAAASTEEDIAWDEDSEDEATSNKAASKAKEVGRPASAGSSTTLHPSTQIPETTLLKPEEAKRKSQDEKSQADSEGSYDVVGAASGAPSHAPSSPKESRKGDDSEDEDWE